MGFLKNQAIKSTTKRVFYEVMNFVNNDLMVNPKADPMDTLNDLVETLRMMGNNDIIIPSGLTHWTDALKSVVAYKVKVELSYDSSMGNREDFDLIMETIRKEEEKIMH